MKKFDTSFRCLMFGVSGVLMGCAVSAPGAFAQTETTTPSAAAAPLANAATTQASAASKKAKTTKPKTPRVRGVAHARILHAIKGGPAVDVYVDEKKVLTAADYKSVSDYVALSSGKRAVKITPTGKSAAIFSGSITLSKDKYFTLAAHGTPEKPLLTRVNETTGKMYEGKTRVFVTHLAQAPAVDITTASTRTKTGYATLAKTLEPGKTRAKSTGIGDATFQVRSGGAVLKDAVTKLEAGKRYAIFAIGSVDALDLIVKPAAPNYAETFAVTKPKKVKLPATKPMTTTTTATTPMGTSPTKVATALVATP